MNNRRTSRHKRKKITQTFPGEWPKVLAEMQSWLKAQYLALPHSPSEQKALIIITISGPKLLQAKENGCDISKNFSEFRGAIESQCGEHVRFAADETLDNHRILIEV